MARITVEDCLNVVPSRFELVVLAARRVHQLFSGAPLTISEDNDKAPVLALRELALGTDVSPDALRNSVVHGMRSCLEPDESECDEASEEEEDTFSEYAESAEGIFKSHPVSRTASGEDHDDDTQEDDDAADQDLSGPDDAQDETTQA
jgi:DNA-directed RNA polymerase subunit omega